jgi:hypothetical protein
MQKSAEQEINESFDITAQQIVEAFGESSLLVVTGPFGIGKTHSVIPRVADLLKTESNIVEIRDCQEYIAPWDFGVKIANSLPTTDNGVVILDEAGEMSALGRAYKRTRHFVEKTHNRNFRIIGVIAYSCGNVSVRDRQTETWQKAEFEISGQEAAVVHLPPKRLDQDLASRFLLAENQKFSRRFGEEVAEYLAEVTPRNLGLLHSLALLAPQSIDEAARTIVTQTSDSNWIGTLSDEENAAMYLRCKDDWLRSFKKQ